MKTNPKIAKEATKILKQFSAAFDALSLDPTHFSQIVEVVIKQKNGGKIVTTGMGKAGIAMRKFSSTLCSFGFPSVYLHPGEASHGDLGLLTLDDILFVASTSGKTREILEIMELARNVNVKSIIGITSHPDSPVREKADLLIDMGVIEEAGHLHIAPTTSILVMIGITDSIALSAAKEMNLTKKDYGKFHHGGYLGSVARDDGKIY
jgi:arabinose-5-phosphate isomerase